MAALSLSVGLKASSIESLSLEALAFEAEHIVQVDVVSIKNVQREGFPHQAIHVDIQQSFKGDFFDEDEAVFYMPGGRDGEHDVLIHGVAEIEAGRTYILFLGDRGEMQWTALRVYRHPETGELVVSRAKEVHRERGHDHEAHQHALSSEGSRVMDYDTAVSRLLSVD